MSSFIGDYPCKIDAKGRIALPSAFIKQLASVTTELRDKFVLRKDIFEKCLVLYSIGEWERQNEIIRNKLNPYNKEHSLFLRGFYKDTAELCMDANNRILVPKRLLEIAEIENDVVLAGQDKKIEIWAKSKYENSTPNDDAFAELAQKILGNY